jgi:hypothetical protein
MKRILALLILTIAASFAHADTINLNGDMYYFTSTFGTNPMVLSTYTSGTGVYATNGTTVGNITTFATAYFTQGFGLPTISNLTFNANTNVLSGSFVWNGNTWYLTETFGPYQSGSCCGESYTYGNITSGKVTTVSEPGTLALLGTGLLGIVGTIRGKLSKRVPA